MTRIESTRQTIGGMQNIEREIIQQVRERKVLISPESFSWNYGRGSLGQLPDPVHLEVQVGSRHAGADWPHVHLQDSWDRIDRPDVHQEIERIVYEPAPQP
jgi:hypothetical protein